MGNPAVDQRARDLLEDRGLVFEDDDDPAPTPDCVQIGRFPHYAQFCAFPEPCLN